MFRRLKCDSQWTWTSFCFGRARVMIFAVAFSRFALLARIARAKEVEFISVISSALPSLRFRLMLRHFREIRREHANHRERHSFVFVLTQRHTFRLSLTKLWSSRTEKRWWAHKTLRSSNCARSWKSLLLLSHRELSLFPLESYDSVAQSRSRNFPVRQKSNFAFFSI